MKLSLMSYTLGTLVRSGEMSLADVLTFTKDNGFAATELSMANFDLVPPQGMSGLLRDLELDVSCINGSADLAIADDDGFQKSVQAGCHMVDTAVQVGSPMIMIVAASVASVAGTADKARAAARIAQGLRQIVAYARDKGIIVTIEDFPRTELPLSSIQEMKFLMEAVPGLKLTFDNGNFLPGGDDNLEAYQALWPYVANVHIKDWAYAPEGEGHLCANGRRIRGGLHGQGILDHVKLFKAMKEKKYDGYLAFEYEGSMNHAEATRIGVSYLRGVLDALD
ncbi:MAG: sugar phosphate isomerase/epimerase [Ruminococcaceae bacterium]|jgi:sugar phosphate isomerase/epimerase|nr:sugar phosphate isomerase/epimerase [Oscillospiraceae bacterium]